MSARLVSAATVRAFFAENPDKVPAEAAKSLAPGARGRLHPKAVEVFNKAKRGKVRDGQGVRDVETVRVGRKNVPLSGLREFAPGKRGKIGAAAIAAYREAHGL